MLGSNSMSRFTLRIIQPEIESVQPPLVVVPWRSWFLFFFLAFNIFHINYALPTEAASCQVVICFSLRDVLAILLFLRLLARSHQQENLKYVQKSHMAPQPHQCTLAPFRTSAPGSDQLLRGHLSSLWPHSICLLAAAHQHCLIGIRSSPFTSGAHL